MKKLKKILVRYFYELKKKKNKLSRDDLEKAKFELQRIEQAILASDRAKANELFKTSDNFFQRIFRKNIFRQGFDFIVALGFALFVAVIVRQIWFEPYEVPTGSMRPTIKEHDRLGVSKLTFGINMPFTPKHLYFDPHLALRNGIITFTGEGMDIRDVDTRYFFIFPGKKQYVKRLIGKPGDVLYFYGGKIYGLDAEGHDISPQLQMQGLEKIDHIPFMRFEGDVRTGKIGPKHVYNQAVIFQMNSPVAKLTLPFDRLQPQGLLTLSDAIHEEDAPVPLSYGKLWGIENFGMARLLNEKQLVDFYGQEALPKVEKGLLYLEIKHSPSFDYLKIGQDLSARFRPMFILATSLIAMGQEELDRAFDALYTARFEVQNGKVYRYGFPNKEKFWSTQPTIEELPDGTYEFYDGEAYKIGWQGIARLLPKTHPLYIRTPERLQFWFNLGIEFHERYTPVLADQMITPSRYTYYRDGDLYLMGSPVWLKKLTCPVPGKNSLLFTDKGAPYLDSGELDIERIKTDGLKIPEGHYLALGDNHAMSADSRDFGFVPEGNLRGAPSFIFWPPGPRFGPLNVVHYAVLTYPRMLIWALAGCIILVIAIYQKKRHQLPLKWRQLDKD